MHNLEGLLVIFGAVFSIIAGAGLATVFVIWVGQKLKVWT